MAIISSQDRAKLIVVLEKQIPAVRDQALLDMFSLMLALLRDYNDLEACARVQAHITLNEAAHMKTIYTQLLQHICHVN